MVQILLRLVANEHALFFVEVFANRLLPEFSVSYSSTVIASAASIVNYMVKDAGYPAEFVSQ